ncbi:hypothetical protein ElyMa_000559100 [Elysia marginata]|uniref:Uncharacterized protein n=1 Tax=Elysia marginata TaxID=1093978 RepID=A0AAV4G3N0_9GAST|nr:hypothetical protein ElyMa_000559100 [Elysia marginata]
MTRMFHTSFYQQEGGASQSHASVAFPLLTYSETVNQSAASLVFPCLPSPGQPANQRPRRMIHISSEDLYLPPLAGEITHELSAPFTARVVVVVELRFQPNVLSKSWGGS